MTSEDRAGAASASPVTEASRLNKEIEVFTKVLEEGGTTSSIPPIFTYWASTYLSPRLREIFGEVNISSLFAKELIESYERTVEVTERSERAFRVISLGSGDCATELEVVKELLRFGMKLEFVCTDLNPTVSAAAEEIALRDGVANSMRFSVVDLNREFPDGDFDAAMANHSLHHFVGLEYIFDTLRRRLHARGSFVVSDMIGRNGHMRWPEALPFVEQLWDLLPHEKKLNFFARCYEDNYVNYDCTSDDSFEGVRAQDILPLLSARFAFRKFVAHGNVVDVFIDRIYGRNFSPADSGDRRFIDYVEKLNTKLIDLGIVKPTAMFATLSKERDACRYSRWSPEFCLRPVV